MTKSIISKYFCYEPDVHLTDYETVFIDDHEYAFEDFEKALNHDYRSHIKSFYYDERFERFQIRYRDEDGDEINFAINITEKQKEQIRNGLNNNSTDNGIQRLFQIEDRKRRDKKKEYIAHRVQETGELPSNNEEIILYAEYLEEQLAERKAEIVRLWGILSIAPDLTLITIYGYTKFDTILGCLAIFGTLISLSLYRLYLEAKLPTYLIETLNEYKILYYKLQLLKERVQQLALEEKKALCLPEGPKVKVYKNEKYS